MIFILGAEQVDERHIPSFRIMHQGKDTVGDGAQEDHHYPFSGKANPKVRRGGSGGSDGRFSRADRGGTVC